VNVLALQMDIAWENKAANYDKVAALLENARPERNALVVLPETFATGFSMNTDTVAEAQDGETGRFLARTAKQYGVCLIGGVAVRGRDERVRNQALVFSPAGERIRYYSKIHLFSPGGEARHYLPGDSPVTFQWDQWTVSPFICYDLRFPETFRQVAAAYQPELFVVIANFPARRVQHWIRLLQARAIENQAFVIGVNRVGGDPCNRYCGRSLVADPQGDIIADAGEAETALAATLELNAVREYRRALPFLDDLAPSGPGAAVERDGEEAQASPDR
jgi:predicted amidohydrolase